MVMRIHILLPGEAPLELGRLFLILFTPVPRLGLMGGSELLGKSQVKDWKQSRSSGLYLYFTLSFLELFYATRRVGLRQVRAAFV
jgi:hypothetical protein